MFISVNIRTTPITEENIKLPFSCNVCGVNEGKLSISRVKLYSILWMSSTMIRADVVCAKCDQKYPKALYGEEIRQLIKKRKTEYKPTFLQKYGLFVFAVSFFCALVIYFFVSLSISKKETEKANENYATTYTETDRVKWLQNLRPGDVVLAKLVSAPYDAPATVFILKSVEEKTITFNAYYTNTIPYNDYRDLSKMKLYSFGKGTSEPWIANKKVFYKTEQLVSALTDDYLKAYSVLQVVKN